MGDANHATDRDRRAELLRQGAEQDGVEIEEYEPRFTPGSRQENRSRRLVVTLWLLCAVFSLVAVGIFVFWPWRYVFPGEEGHFHYSLYTPLLGLFLGLAVACVAAALILHVKLLLPKETAVQERKLPGPSSEEDRATMTAMVLDTAQQVGIGSSRQVGRRSAVGKAMGLGAGVLGTSVGVIGVAGFIENPWDAQGPRADRLETLWHTGWYPHDGEKVYLRVETTDPEEVVLVRPADIAPGGLLAVFPFRESDRGNPRKLRAALNQADNPATLYRFRPEDDIEYRPDRAGMNWGDYYAFSRVCTHVGCAVNLFEDQTNRAYCPCHQSQFDLNRHAKPIFGPAARPLPQLPIDVDDEGFFYALGDFTGPVGPSFWELPAAES
ncbi:ubiquinol-cytochrome c reductase iron-sulfur subunit [Prauserella shujinwangii]|uniref:Cytochrome bc1 complex Rieske iron-sulfur subunit n=1 Tax=Prauserella shujinwangii TaxID=1453103 RepID=A0A2T0LL80_9PSEU|nr:Rieske 2Fe-2S domain-containing protein [Prauserella shujinwangii]PRX43705.1 ubiquinol-cytochrome c reductase iron-sulfur subunit [Prauserella shujinwangii]